MQGIKTGNWFQVVIDRNWKGSSSRKTELVSLVVGLSLDMPKGVVARELDPTRPTGVVVSNRKRSSSVILSE